ncbi:hypothetical protein FJ945_20505 [Mesorhizobium sp. B2-4-9]|uniref:hypothetical protein n=1 Tax=Mesorhizobium sp. B2-4-9 TaxID=2589940 RepID=UPI00112A0A4F|nr:hypothetical protein [Mesorhizobium sp. B2-4-9]TPL21097.1 hypothetical protein FJ945_20505 [Mesorhizobium sp. B2-4-9]
MPVIIILPVWNRSAPSTTQGLWSTVDRAKAWATEWVKPVAVSEQPALCSDRTNGPAVDAVVIEGQSLGDTGLRISHFKDRGKATAAAGERLNGGLRSLGQSYGILRK